MKKIFAVLALMYCVGAGAQNPAQRTFEVTSTGSVQNIAPYVKALENTFLDRYRSLEYRSVMKFKEGVVVELYSVKELTAMNIPVNTAVVGTLPPKGITFTLLSSGRIVQWTPTQTTR